MPPPLGALAKALKLPKALEDIVTIEGRTISKGNLAKFEIEKALRNGGSHADVVRALKENGVAVDNDWIKNQIGVAKRRDPVMKKSEPDETTKRMHANWIIENGHNHGESWEVIGNNLEDAGFKEGGRIARELRQKAVDRAMSQPRPAVIDNGESGPQVGEQIDNGYQDLRHFKDEDLTAALKKVGDEIASRKNQQNKDLRQQARDQNAQGDWTNLEQLGIDRQAVPDPLHPIEPKTDNLREGPLQPATEKNNPLPSE